MNSRKSQIGLRELMTTLIVAGLLAIVGVMIFSKVSSTTEDIFDRDTTTVINESISITTISNTITNESITMTSQIGTTGNGSLIDITFFGNATNSTHLANVATNTDVNWTKAGTVTVSGEHFPAAGPYNISYTYSSNGTGTTTYGPASTEDVTVVTFFGNATMSTHITGIDITEEVNWTAAGIISTNTINFSDGTYNISYTYDSDTDAMATKNTIEDTVLDSFELAVIALIILAAVVILGTLFMLGGK